MMRSCTPTHATTFPRRPVVKCDICRWDPNEHDTDHWTLAGILRLGYAEAIADKIADPDWDYDSYTQAAVDLYRQMAAHHADLKGS